jgi:hypothetical protein
MSDTQTPAAPTDDARVAAALDSWKRKLLDLSKRNRALNFRMTRASTVAIVDEQPAEVFRRLYLLEKRMRFAAAPPPAPASAENASPANTSLVVAPVPPTVAADTSSNLPTSLPSSATPPPPFATTQGDLLADDTAASAAPENPADAVREGVMPFTLFT